jgi:hypothetical protein
MIGVYAAIVAAAYLLTRATLWGTVAIAIAASLGMSLGLQADARSRMKRVTPRTRMPGSRTSWS